MAGFVAGHFVNGVVDGIEICGLCTLCKVELTGGCTVFGFNAHLEVLLRAVRYNFAEQLCELCSVLCFFVSSLLPVKADFRIGPPETAASERKNAACDQSPSTV